MKKRTKRQRLVELFDQWNKILLYKLVDIEIRELDTGRINHSSQILYILQTMLEYLDKLQKEDLNSLLEKHKAQREIMKEVEAANEALKEQKQIQKDQERLSELKVMQYLKEKAVRLTFHMYYTVTIILECRICHKCSFTLKHYY